MVLDEQIITAQLTLQQLSLQRQLKQVRDQRRAANEQHRKYAQHCEERMAQAARRCRVMIHGMRNLSEYFSVVRAFYPSNPGGYVLRKHAKLLMCIRSQHILEKYNLLAEHQYGMIIEDLEETVQDLRMEVREVRHRREQEAYLLQEQKMVLAISRIKSYYQEKKNDTRNGKNVHQTPALFQQLVSRKANTQLLTCIQKAWWGINDSLHPLWCVAHLSTLYFQRTLLLIGFTYSACRFPYTRCMAYVWYQGSE